MTKKNLKKTAISLTCFVACSIACAQTSAIDVFNTLKNIKNDISAKQVERLQISSQDTSTSNSSKLIWTDPKTNLTWTRCIHGSVFESSRDGHTTCSVETRVTNSWFEAVLFTKQHQFAGFSDWRIPTVTELLTIYKCRDMQREGREKPSNFTINVSIKNNEFKCDEPSDSQRINGNLDAEEFRFWTSTPILSSYEKTDSSYEKIKTEGDRYVYNRRFIRQQHGSAGMLFVRGATPSAEWNQALIEAEEVSQLWQKRASQQDKVNLQQKAEYDQRQLANKQYEEKQEAVYQKELKRVQTSVSVGEEVAQGLVLEVKGELVLIQRYEYKCFSPYVSGKCSALDYKKVPLAQEWMKKNTLRPKR